MQAYCMKCKKKVEIKNPKAITMKNKRPATQGVCTSCGTKVFRIGKQPRKKQEQGPLDVAPNYVNAILGELPASRLTKLDESDLLNKQAIVKPGYQHRLNPR